MRRSTVTLSDTRVVTLTVWRLNLSATFGSLAVDGAALAPTHRGEVNRKERRALPRALREQRANIRTKADAESYLDALERSYGIRTAARSRKTVELLGEVSDEERQAWIDQTLGEEPRS